MATIYERIEMLCSDRGITGGKMCNDLGISRSTMTELRKGRVTTLKLEKARKIATYFGVTLDDLLGTEQQKAPTPEGERPITFDDFTYAMYEEGKELSEENKKRLLEMAIFFRQQQEKETQ